MQIVGEQGLGVKDHEFLKSRQVSSPGESGDVFTGLLLIYPCLSIEEFITKKAIVICDFTHYAFWNLLPLTTKVQCL